MRAWLGRPLGRIVAVVVGLGAVAAVVAAINLAIYVYGAPARGTGGGAASATATAAPTLTAGAGGVVFTIDGSGSKASFTTHEVLLGQPKTVVGTTSGVSGQIRVDESAPARSQVGVVRVNLTGLATDSDMRNNTIQNRILETGDPANQYAVFTAKSISGMPASVAVGQKVSFKLTGDLTIHQVTRTVTFDVTVTLTSAKTLTGHAQTTVNYSDFNIAIPNVPNVSDVSNA
ncbi:MAG: YceI family protein, partial [Chloroflexota bacterium]|nr:YceI family protein [Chloroflexota bacterium]